MLQIKILIHLHGSIFKAIEVVSKTWTIGRDPLNGAQIIMVADDSLIMKLVVEGGNADSLEKLQKILEKHGLLIEGRTRSGFILSGTTDCFEEVFKPDISKKNNDYLFQAKPIYDKLPSNMDYRVYIPKKPTYF